MNIKEEFQQCLRMAGEDYQQRQGVPLMCDGEWHQTGAAIGCPVCDCQLFSIGQGTQVFWCETCEELSHIEIDVSPVQHDDDGGFNITIGEPKIIKEVQTTVVY